MFQQSGTPWFCQHSFCSTKNGAGLRPVINLKHIPHEHFKIESIQMLKDLQTKGFYVKVRLKRCIPNSIHTPRSSEIPSFCVERVSAGVLLPPIGTSKQPKGIQEIAETSVGN